MSLQFIIGNSGAGKSGTAYENIIREASANPDRLYYVIVPEQFTMQTQKTLVEMHPDGGILNIDILSFERLAYRVFEEVGGDTRRIMEKKKKNMVLQKLVQMNQKDLVYLRNQMKKPGYLDEVKSLISEFMQYEIKEEELDEMIRESEDKTLLQMKLQDVKVLYQAFREYLSGHFMTAEEVLEVLAKEIQFSEKLKGSVLLLDGYTGFTPVQVNLLKTLFPMTDRVWAAVTLDKRVDPFCVTGIQELFHMSQKMVRTLLELADEAKCEVLEPIRVEDGRQYRYGNAKALLHLEENLFRSSLKAYPKEQEEIQIQSCQNRKEELEFAAATISRMVREEDYRYRDFAIVSGAAAEYANYVKEIFEAYGIPYFIDEKKTILFHPFIEFLRASLEMVEEDFSYESVMRYFRSGLSRQSTEEIDRLENYILATGIRGYRKCRGFPGSACKEKDHGKGKDDSTVSVYHSP